MTLRHIVLFCLNYMSGFAIGLMIAISGRNGSPVLIAGAVAIGWVLLTMSVMYRIFGLYPSWPPCGTVGCPSRGYTVVAAQDEGGLAECMDCDQQIFIRNKTAFIVDSTGKHIPSFQQIPPWFLGIWVRMKAKAAS